MQTYRIIGADQKQYGPVTSDQIRYWISESRVNAQTQARAEGDQEWKPLSAFPEFAGVLAAGVAPPLPSPGAGVSAVPIEELLVRDYDLAIGGCVSAGWNLLKNNFGLLFCGVLIYVGIELGAALLGAIPVIGMLFTLANIFIVGPLLGGLYYLYLQAIRRQPATAGDVFMGFRTRFLQLFLGNLVPGLLAGLCLIPAVIAAIFLILPPILQHRSPTLGSLVILVAVFCLCMVPMIFLRINWMFTLPLIVDRKLDFWPAMQTSWKMTGKHWWQVFGLLILVGLINLGGLLLCGVGLLFTVSIGMGAMMYAYETIFGSGPTRTA